MSIKVIIERRFKKEPLPENFHAINELRGAAMRQRGHISGETLVNMEDSRDVVVISSWTNLDDWRKWASSEQRRLLEEELSPYLQKPATQRICKLGADAIVDAFEKFVHDAD